MASKKLTPKDPKVSTTKIRTARTRLQPKKRVPLKKAAR